MEQRVRITPEENQKVESLFLKYNAYMSMLAYLASESGNMSGTDFYNSKWNEASQLWIDLDKEKRIIEQKYKPAGTWERYEFDFENQQVVFSK